MKPNRVGRGIGVGMRVASGMLRDRAAHTAQTVRQDAPQYAARGKAAAAGAKRGAKRFGESFWGPFAHVGSVLWLEITGVFFAIFGLFFIQNAWRLHAAWQSGPQHERFLMYAAIAIVFLYFSISSFYRASKKQKRKNQLSQSSK
ncbi:MAG TPA: hypothetical protein VMU92_08655 [Acidobacteriaceae bacterium]|nr:hypothetical protein [Acidobacteriaceae bacterium]